MTQPKSAPMSVRPGEARLAVIDAAVAKRGTNRHAELMRLLDLGIAADGPGLPAPEVRAGPKAEPVRRPAAAKVDRTFRGVTALGETIQPGPFKDRLKKR